MDTEKQPRQFFDSFLFPRIFQSFRIAIQPAKLIIAFLAVAIICLAGWLMDFRKTVVVTPNRQGRITELEVYMLNTAQTESFIEQYEQTNRKAGVFSTLWHFGSARFHAAIAALFSFDLTGVARNIGECFKAVMWALRYHFLYSVIFFGIALAVTAAAGGALCRAAAMQFARSEKCGMVEAVTFGVKRFVSLLITPVVPVIMVVVVALGLLLIGLILNLPRIGEILTGLSMPLAMLAGAVITIILIGAVAGFNLMFPAVAYDGADCFDAISRSLSYVYARPWRMGFYTATAVVYGAICYTFARFFAFVLLLTTHLIMQFAVFSENPDQVNKLIAIWPAPTFANLPGVSDAAAVNWSQSAAAFLIHLSVLAVIGLLVAFVISFYFSANTIIYALMRSRVDNTPLADIDICVPQSTAAADVVAPAQEPQTQAQQDQTPPEEEGAQQQ